jgi:membrane-associated phospholipid phosphatase
LRFRPRPAEIVLLSFVAYGLLRVLTAPSAPEPNTPHALPRGDIFIALLFVVVLRMGLRYRETPWPAGHAREARLFALTFLPALLFGVLPGAATYVFLPQYLPRLTYSGGAVSGTVLFVYSSVRALLAFLVPGAFFWVTTGLYVKKHGRLSARGLLVEGAPAALEVLRDWAPPLVLVYCYVALGPMLSQRLFPDRDPFISRIDQALFFGHNPSELCEKIISAPLSEWLSACYTFYLPLFPLVLGAIYAKRERHPFREGAFALSLVLAVGYVGYGMVPVVGPLFFQKFDKSLDIYYTAWIKNQLMDRTRVPRDCFPSLHTAASLTLLWASRHVRKLAWALSPIVLSIPFACVYLRYHYVTDVLAGMLLFVAVTRWTSRSRSLQAAFHH